MDARKKWMHAKKNIHNILYIILLGDTGFVFDAFSYQWKGCGNIKYELFHLSSSGKW